MMPRARQSLVSIALAVFTTIVAAPAPPAAAQGDQVTWGAVSYTHLTLPTIYSV